MPNTFFGLSIAKSGLYTYQAAINTAAHNSSNADTEGYSRQQTIRSASTALSIPGSYGMAGTGVDVNGIVQVRNFYYDVKFWNNNAVYGNYNTKQYYLTNIENYLSEVNADGTTAVFDDMFTSMSGLMGSVGDITKRTQVSEYSQTFADYMNSIYTNLQNLQDECNFEIKNTADQINALAEQIATLTRQINTAEVRGAVANDLRDSRALLVDQLSELANVTVVEQSMGEGKGLHQYIVRLDGKTLVDTYEYNTLQVVPQEAGVNQNDISGLYMLKWSNGQNFDARSTTLSGKLRALFDVRDGNNKLNFNGTTTATKGATTIEITGANITDFNLLNIPDANGKIKIGPKEYTYESFKATKTFDTNGNATVKYTFKLTEALTEDATKESVKIGDSIEYKGIPYYMAQLNEFVRTFAATFNDIHKTGTDLNGDDGLDFFTGKVPSTGKDMTTFDPVRDHTAVAVGVSYSEWPPLPITIDSSTYGSYYHITAGNFKVSETILDEPKKIACSENRAESGIEDAAVLKQLLDLKSDETMFKQGRPDSFLQTMVGVMGIDAKAAKGLTEHQDNIVKAINAQRMSVSGVDSDEEAMNMTKFKYIYDLNCRVVTIMNEIYDKLINQTGI